jgi:hypothetical protein
MRPAPATPMRIDVYPMTKSAFFAATAAFVFAAAPGIAEETTPVEWSQLPDESAQIFEDPYRDLAPEQMSDLMSLVRLREELGTDTLTTEERGQLEAQAAKLETALQAGGIDVEWLLSQRWVVADWRRLAAVAVNSALDGQLVEITGFLIPAPPMDSGEQTAYLLPDRSVCNHLPPPPPNQLVRLLMKDAPEVGGSCAPAAVRGTLRAEETQYEVIVIDHSLAMWSAWTLETHDVRVVDRFASDTPIPR